MVTCPRGHNSTATDYCDECGAPIGGSTPASAAPAAGSPPSTSAAGSGEPCPECATPRDGRFCEVCGHDFLAEPSPTAGQVPSATVGPDAPQGSGAVPVGESTAGTPVVSGLPPSPQAPGWRVVVSADREYFDRMQAADGPDAAQVAFPAYCPQRRFELTGAQLLIGRRSRSRGVEPEIDLTGPPEDAGVSHTHALLVAGADGRWSVVDLDSANGTYLNDSSDPIAAHTPTPLVDGDRVHVGAFTTLTVQAG